MNERYLMSGARVGADPGYDWLFPNDTKNALDLGQNGNSFSWDKAFNALLGLGVSYATAKIQADAARNAYNSANQQGYNLYQTGYRADAENSITKYLPWVAVGALALILILKK